jgi:hypothetical protein
MSHASGFIRLDWKHGTHAAEKQMARGDEEDEAATTQPVFTCDECGAELVLAKGRKSSACPYCKCPSVHELADQDPRPEPALVLPFIAAESAARAAVHAWTRRFRFFRETLSDATIEQIEGVYLPAYLYSASTASTYSARIGENYTETETYTTTENGKSVTRTRTVTKTEYRSLSGDFVGYVADVFVTASKGLPNHELEHIEPFDLRMLRRYDAALISGWTAEHPSLEREKCEELARAEATEQIGKRLGEHMPGDSYMSLEYQTQVDRETLDLTLVPVWVLVIRPDPKRPPLRVLANGQTLEVWGPEKLSVLKIVMYLAILALVVVVVALLKGAAR